MNVLEHLIAALRGAAVYNQDVQVAPACVLWPDHDRQWQEVLPQLQAALPELLVLGDYAPEERRGPAIWLRCVIAGYIPEVTLPSGSIPLIYLPGYSRQDLRAVESCDEALKPLAELQYRGVIWSQINARDWTILAFLSSAQGGLGLDVAQDSATRRAMQSALARLLEEETATLQGKYLDSDYFNGLLTGGDLLRDLLHWLDQGDTFRARRSANEWQAFVEICVSQLGYNPQQEGVPGGCRKLAQRQGLWAAAWQRFCEAPRRYAQIPQQLRTLPPPRFGLFDDVEAAGSWPQWNDAQEQLLREELHGLADVPLHTAREVLQRLEQHHGPRRALVWAELGEAPLARALQHLALMAQLSNHSLAAGTLQDVTDGYRTHGWRIDDAVLQALAQINRTADSTAVHRAVRAVYLPWLEAAAQHLQKIVDGNAYPGGTALSASVPAYTHGDCLLFVDALRYDLGMRLQERLTARGHQVEPVVGWAALPSVTATGKPAVTPVRDRIRGNEGNAEFMPVVAAGGQALQSQTLKRLLTDAGWTILAHHDSGDGHGLAWTEFGDIDHAGHERGWKLAGTIDTLLNDIVNRVDELLNAGWRRVQIVTDHGWLLMPDGLPKIELPTALTENTWGRCAVLKAGAWSAERLYPWYWNPQQSFALAHGISCFISGREYSHGGISLQECLTLQLTIRPAAAPRSGAAITAFDVGWRSLRCTVAVESEISGLRVDIRRYANDPTSSLVVAIKALKPDGSASVVVEDESLEGQSVSVVLIDDSGALIAERLSVVGGGVRD